MSLCNCSFKCNCTVLAVIASLILGILAAFLQITGTIAVTPVFLWVAFGIAVVYLAILVLAAAQMERTQTDNCVCSARNALLLGILGTILFSVVLLAVGITAASVISAILVGLLVFFFALTFASSACFVRALSECGN